MAKITKEGLGEGGKGKRGVMGRDGAQERWLLPAERPSATSSRSSSSRKKEGAERSKSKRHLLASSQPSARSPDSILISLLARSAVGLKATHTCPD